MSRDPRAVGADGPRSLACLANGRLGCWPQLLVHLLIFHCRPVPREGKRCFRASRHVPLPHLLTPGDAHVVHRDEGDGWFRFTLSFRHRLFGETYFQEGLFHQTEGLP